jgi:cardiolipin synthase
VPSWVPNAITLLRIALIPVWWIQAQACADASYYGDETDQSRLLAVVTLTAIGISDVVDGFVARRFGLVSRAGATLDAVADKLAQVSLLVFFTFYGELAFEPVPLGFFILVLARDMVLGAGTLLVKARRGAVAVAHAWHGKLSSLLLFTLLFALTINADAQWIRRSIWALAFFITISTVLYVRDGWSQWRHRPALTPTNGS